MSSASQRPRWWPLCFASILLLTPGSAVAAWPDPPKTDSHGDPLPDGALFRLGTLRYRHADFIGSSALSADGKFLATAGSGHVAVFDLATGRRVHFFRDCGAPRSLGEAQVAFSPDGKHLAHLSTTDVAARVWDLGTGKLLREVGNRSGNLAIRIGGGLRGKMLLKEGPGRPPPDKGGLRTDSGLGLRYSPDGKELLAYSPSRISAFDVRTGERLRAVTPFDPPGAVSADGKRLACLFSDNGVRSVSVSEVDTGSEELRYAFPVPAGEEWHARLAFAPDGKTLAAVVYPRLAVRLWALDGRTGPRTIPFAPARSGPQEPQWVSAVRFSPNGKVLLLGTNAGAIHRVDLAAGKALPPLRGHGQAVTGLHFLPDGKTLVSTSADATIRRWDLARGEEVLLPNGYAGAVRTALAPDGKRAAVGDLAGRLDLWDAATGRHLRTLRSAGPGIHQIAFAPDGKALALACQDGVVRLLASDSGEEIGALRLPGDRVPTCLAFSPAGGRLLTVARLDGLRVWDLAARKPLWSTAIGDFGVAAFSPDGKRVVSGGRDATLTARDAAQGNTLFAVPVGQDAPFGEFELTYIDALAFSPDGRVLASAHRDGPIRLWDPATGKELKRLRGHKGEVGAVRFSPDGKWLISAGADGTARVWEVLTGQEVRKLVGHDGRVREAVFGPGGRTLLTSGGVEALAWDLRPGPPPASDAAALWEGLRAPDPAAGYAAVWALAQRGKDASVLLREKIAPVRLEDAKGYAKWLAELDSPRYAVREGATRALAERGDTAMPVLRAALAGPGSPEARRRLEFLVNVLQREPTPEEVRRARAVQALELAATPEAREVLRAWASGAAGAALTEDARAALGRLP